jgi:UDP-N-acetylmuramoyl-tripeptide--D-alanyl-D-alanine ligase
MATPIPENRARFSVEEIVRAAGGTAADLDPALKIEGIWTDSRAAPKNGLFVALVGLAHDGHDYAAKARERGALVLVARGRGIEGPRIEVDDTLIALGAIARYFVERETAGRDVPILAIGGAAGKTTTKTLAAAAVSALFGETLVTAGNLNNRIGVPMTLFTLTPRHQAVVLEHGTSERGEIAALVRISAPDVGLVVNVGVEHSEGLGGLEEIADEEANLLFAARKFAVANGDDPLLAERAERASARKLYFGGGARAGVRIAGRSLEHDGSAIVRLELRDPTLLADGSPRELRVPTRLLGEHAALNIAAAVAAALALRGRPATEAELTSVSRAIATVEAVPGRLRPIPANELLVIDDSYNANPRSVRAALATAREVADRRRSRLVIALGDMLELGSLSAAEHDGVVRAADGSGAAALVIVGIETAQAAARLGENLRTPCMAFLTSVEAAAEIAGVVSPHDVLLVKGSRGMRMERLIEALEKGE